LEILHAKAAETESDMAPMSAEVSHG